MADRTYAVTPFPKSMELAVAESGVMLFVPTGVVNVTGLLINALRLMLPEII
ncbi:hypothetical protein ACK8P5_11745 [Paenibacillus sp. EC2-1]|uniref:hypothetical protein n=1 Tax=Paenibacillus sp. EC2-1 TaxID=3388665 RepID=UPI003BEF42E2